MSVRSLTNIAMSIPSLDSTIVSLMMLEDLVFVMCLAHKVADVTKIMTKTTKPKTPIPIAMPMLLSLVVGG